MTHRMTIMLISVFLVLPVSACTRHDAPAPRPAAPHVEMHASLSAAAGTLTIDYQAVNADSVPVVVFNGVPARDTVSTPATEPNAVYVSPGGGGVVEVAKRLFQVPNGVNPAARYLLRGTVLAPGQRVSEHLTVALPLTVRVPYPDANGKRPTLPDPVRQVRFCLGTARADQVHAQPEADGGDTTHPVYPHGFDADRLQYLQCSAAQALPT